MSSQPDLRPGIPGTGYVRHRDRMIQESVFEDLRNTLIAFRWLSGTTTREVYDPENGNVFQVITVTDDQTLGLMDIPMNLIDFFPQAEEGAPPASLNTFALDQGIPGDQRELELGSRAVEQEHTFNMAFYAASDAVALAVMNDLRDRYRGVIVAPDSVVLYDFNSTPVAPVVRMDVDSFRYERSTELSAQAFEINLYFAELVVVDINES